VGLGVHASPHRRHVPIFTYGIAQEDHPEDPPSCGAKYSHKYCVTCEHDGRANVEQASVLEYKRGLDKVD